MRIEAKGGVGTEYPANTITAILAAGEQNYDSVCVNVGCTADGEFVICGREQMDMVSGWLKEDRNAYDAGGAFHVKFKGMPLASLQEVPELALNREKPMKSF